MDRYSILHGTTQAGPYDRLGMSQGLPAFLSRMGATSLNVTTGKVESLLCGFQKLDGYDRQPTDDPPLAVRYAPMHLYRLADFPPTMEPFCVFAVCGAEDRAGGRDSVYFHTTYFPRTAMYRTVEGYSYLDQLFGTHLTTSADLDGHRSGKLPADLDAPPEKVAPQMDIREAAVVLKTVHAIYQEKTVIIRLKKGCSFNRCAFRLLPQIYSMLQPRLAAEIGFATYHHPQKIGELANLTSTRIFILPGECSLEQVTLAEYVLLDLDDPDTCRLPGDDETMKWLKWWYKLPWADRLDAYTQLFDRDEVDYLNREKFAEVSAGFRNDPFFQWVKAGSDAGSIATTTALLKKKRSFSACAVHWVGELFNKRIPELLQPHTLEDLTAEGAVEAILGPDKESGKVEYLAGLELGCKDVTALVCKKTRDRVRAAANQAIAELKETQETEKAQLQQLCDSKLADLTAQCEARIAAMNAEFATLQEAHRQKELQWQGALEAQKKESAARLAQAQSAMEALRVEKSQALAKAKEEADATLNEQKEAAQQAMKRQQEEAAATLAREREAAATALKQQREEASQQMAALKEQATKLIQAERAKTQQAEAQAEEVRQAAAHYRQQAESKLTEAAQALKQSRKEADDLQAQLEAETAAHENTRKRLRKFQSNGEHGGAGKKNLLLTAAIGFLAGLLVLGIVWGAVALLGGKDEPAQQNPPAYQQEQTPGQTGGTDAPPVETGGATEETGATGQN